MMTHRSCEGIIMNATIKKARAAAGLAVFCLFACYSVSALAQTQAPASKNQAPPTGTTGATAFQPSGSARGEVEAGTGAQTGNGGAQQQAGKPGFDNKPPKAAKANCHRPQGGVDASGGENIATASKDNTTCTGKDKAKPKSAK
jgi:hypothetical protein